MPSLEAWVQRPSGGLIKSEENCKRFNLKQNREVGIEPSINN